MSRTLIYILILQAISSFGISAQTYYVSSIGSDYASGLSPFSAWQSLQNVNTTQFEPGDSILFHRGDTWRGYIIPKSGDMSLPIYYGAYGSGTKPVIQGSISLNDPAQWISQGDNIWAILPPVESHPSILQDTWQLWTEGGANAMLSTDSNEFYSAPGSMKISTVTRGSKKNHIQLINSSAFNVEYGRIYKLSFFAKATSAFVIPDMVIHKFSAPYTRFSQGSIKLADMSTEWKAYSIYFKMHVNSSEGRLTIFLGGDIPDGSALYLDDIALEKVSDIPVYTDVGNIILNDEQNVGFKKWTYSDLQTPREFYYNYNTSELFMYSVENPALVNTSIEACLSNHLIVEDHTSHVKYENLMLRYSGGYGIKGRETSNISVSHCDFEYIGGAAMTGSIRYGNGVEFWGNASDNIVEYCTFREIYDAAVSNQNSDGLSTQNNIVYRYNFMENCEYSFEYWNRPESSVTDNIIFENNTCINAGMGWGHAQRQDPHGYHLAFYHNLAQTDSVIVRNNIFYQSSDLLFFERQSGVHDNYFDYNCWYDPDGQMIYQDGKYYAMDSFGTYQTNSGLDAHSIVTDPGFVNPENGDFMLVDGSPCIDAGIGYDPDGSRRDMGAFQYTHPLRISEALNQPGTYRLHQNYPNPFNPSTTIRYGLPEDSNVSLVIYDVQGQVVQTLESAPQPVGWYNVVWNGQTSDGKTISTGIYFARLFAGDYSQVVKMLYLK